MKENLAGPDASPPPRPLTPHALCLAEQQRRHDDLAFIAHYCTGQQFLAIRWEALSNDTVNRYAWHVADQISYGLTAPK